MEDVFRWSLLVLGGCTIVGVAIHGIWVSRKNAEDKQDGSARQQREPEYDEVESDSAEPMHASKDDFDELGLGAVRVISSESSVMDSEGANFTAQAVSPEDGADNNAINPSENNVDDDSGIMTEQAGDTSIEPQPIAESITDDNTPKTSGPIYASVVTQPKPEFVKAATPKHTTQAVKPSTDPAASMPAPQLPTEKASTEQAKEPSPMTSQGSASQAAAEPFVNTAEPSDVPEPPPFLLKKDQAETTTNESVSFEPTPSEPLSKAASLKQHAKNLVKGTRQTPTAARKEPQLGDDQMRIDFEEPSAAQSTPPPEQQVLVLNVKAPDGEPISGAALLPMLLTLGFKFGDQDIFHRHVNSSGKGPVLFSLANMFKPGVFDIDNLENFSTQGVSLFMILPIEGEPHQVFNMMHNAARKIADEFGAQVYDAKREVLTKQSLQQYVEKIRAFEKQRLSAG